MCICAEYYKILKKSKIYIKVISDIYKSKDPILRCKFSKTCFIKSMKSYSKFPKKLLIDMDNLILHFLWKDKKPRIANIIVKNIVGELTLPNFKI